MERKNEYDFIALQHLPLTIKERIGELNAKR